MIKRTLILLRLLGVAALFTAMVSCTKAVIVGGEDGRDEPRVNSASTIFAPEGVKNNPRNLGLYLSSVEGDPSCCWLAPNASIVPRRPVSIHTVIWLALPAGVSRIQGSFPSVVIRLAGRIVARGVALHAGINPIRITPTLPDTSTISALNFESTSFVPDHVFHNGDTRRLGVMLRAINSGAWPSTMTKPWIVPPGLVVSDDRVGADVIDGVYPASDLDWKACCWMAPKTTLRFQKRPGQHSVRISVNVPSDVASYKAHRPSIRLAYKSKILREISALPLGLSHIDVALPPDVLRRSGIFDIAVSTSEFIPAKDQHNGDTRHLGVRLESISSS